MLYVGDLSLVSADEVKLLVQRQAFQPALCSGLERPLYTNEAIMKGLTNFRVWLAIGLIFSVLGYCLLGGLPILSTNSGGGGYSSGGSSSWDSGGSSDSGSSWDSGSWDSGGSDSGSWDSGGSDSGSWDSGGSDSGSWDSGGSDSGSW